MLGWVVRIILAISAFITSWFVARDELKFDIIQMVVGVLLFSMFILIIACWPMIKNWKNKNKN